MERKRSLLADVTQSQLVVIDVQSRLAAVMADADRERVIRHVGILAQAAGLLLVPVMATEQYPRGLGTTEPGVSAKLPGGTAILAKSCFACTGDEAFRLTLAANDRPQVILAGMEAHVCVLQTALELLVKEHQVFVVEDATCSRHSDHHGNAMRRMREAGVVVTNTESLIFEWLRDASHPQFKAVSSLVK